MSDATVVLLVLAGAVVAFVTNRVSVGVVAVLTTLALLATGVVDARTALAGFGDPVVVFIATLFVVSEGLESAGVTAWPWPGWRRPWRWWRWGRSSRPGCTGRSPGRPWCSLVHHP